VAKSEYGLPAKNNATKMQISYEEYSFKWDYGMGKYPNMSIEEFNQKIKEIRHEQKYKNRG